MFREENMNGTPNCPFTWENKKSDSISIEFKIILMVIKWQDNHQRNKYFKINLKISQVKRILPLKVTFLTNLTSTVNENIIIN